MASEQRAVKASERDLPVVAAKGLDAGTVVAATAFLAQRAGIRVLAWARSPFWTYRRRWSGWKR